MSISRSPNTDEIGKAFQDAEEALNANNMKELAKYANVLYQIQDLGSERRSRLTEFFRALTADHERKNIHRESVVVPVEQNPPRILREKEYVPKKTPDKKDAENTEDEGGKMMELTSDDLFSIANSSLNKETQALMDACTALVSIGRTSDEKEGEVVLIDTEHEDELKDAFAALVRAVMRIRFETKLISVIFNMYCIRRNLPLKMRTELSVGIQSSIDAYVHDKDEEAQEDEESGPTADDLRKEKDRRRKRNKNVPKRETPEQ